MDSVATFLFLSFFLAFLLLIFVKIRIYQRTKGKRLPPGPKGLALIRMLHSLRKNAHLQFMKYGDICTVWIGTEPMIALNTYKAIHAALVTQGDIFVGRPQSSHLDTIIHKSGVAFIDGPKWKEHRRFIMRMLRELGVGKPLVEEIVTDECSLLRESIEAVENVPVKCPKLISPNMCNVIGRLLFNERFTEYDPELENFLKAVTLVLGEPPLTFLPIFAWLAKVPFIRYIMPNILKLENSWKGAHSYFKRKMKQHEATLKSMESFPKDFKEATNICDALLIERNNQESIQPGNHTFVELQLVEIMIELFGAAIDTTVGTLNWAVLLMATHPEIQQKVQSEIANEIGRDRLPTMADMAKLPYSSAVLDEIYRFSSISTLGVVHRTLEDTELLGYFIPENSIVQTNLHGVHHDPEVWERPNDFYPAHFLTSDGQYQPSKYLIPFSIGKRSCLGEPLGRMSVGINYVMIMQNFGVKMADPNADLKAIIGNISGVNLHPLPHDIIFSRIV